MLCQLRDAEREMRMDGGKNKDHCVCIMCRWYFTAQHHATCLPIPAEERKRGVCCCVSACLTLYLSVCLSVCLPDWLPACLSVCLAVCLDGYISTCLSHCRSVYLSAYLPACLSVCLLVYLNVSLTVFVHTLSAHTYLQSCVVLTVCTIHY